MGRGGPPFTSSHRSRLADQRWLTVRLLARTCAWRCHFSEGSSERPPVQRGKPGQGVPSKQAAADPRLRLDRTDASIVAIRQITIAPIDTPRHSPLVQWPDTASHAAVSSAQGHSPGLQSQGRRGTRARNRQHPRDARTYRYIDMCPGGRIECRSVVTRPLYVASWVHAGNHMPAGASPLLC